MEDENRIITIEELSEKLLNGDIETIRKYLKIYGTLTVNLALLRNAVLSKLVIPKTKGYPPGIFIAYRWESDKHKAWVFRLASFLRSKGYKVFFDQFEVDLQPKEFYQIPDFISSIVECQYFLIIFSPGYIDNVTARTNKTSWVYDEYQQALLLVKNMKLKIRGVLACGDEVLSICDNYNTVSLQEYSEDFDRLEQIFQFNNLVDLGVEQNKTLIELLSYSDSLFKQNDLNGAYNSLFQYPGFSELFEVKFRLMKCLSSAGYTDEAVEIALSLVNDSELDINTVFPLVDVLVSGRQYAPALKKLLNLKKAITNRSTFNTRFKGGGMAIKTNYFDTYPELISDDVYIGCYLQLGSVLDDVRSYHSAINHYAVCLSFFAETNFEDRSTLTNNIGVSYLSLKEYAVAVKLFKQALALNPNDSKPYGSLIACLLALSKEKEAEAILKKAKKQFQEYDYVLDDFRIDDTNETKGKPPVKIKKSSVNETFSCDRCHSEFNLNQKTQNICGDCASIYYKQDDLKKTSCPYCENNGFVPISLLDMKDGNYNIECPVCAKGRISKK